MSNKITLEQADRLEKLGFYPKSNLLQADSCRWNPVTLRKIEDASVSEALDYLREEKRIACGVFPNIDINLDNKHLYEFEGYYYLYFVDNDYTESENFDTHPLAESALLTAVLDYLEKKGGEG